MSTRMTTLKGVFPEPKPIRRRNFIQENVKNLKQMGQYFHNTDLEDFQNLHIRKQQKIVNKSQNETLKKKPSVRTLEAIYKTGASRSGTDKSDKHVKKLSVPALFGNDSTTSKKISKAAINKNPALIKKKCEKNHEMKKSLSNKNNSKVPSDPNVLRDRSQDDEDNKPLIKYRNQGIQTLEDKDLGELYTEGIIRYPTKKNVSTGDYHKHSLGGNLEKTGKLHLSPPSDRGDMRSSPVKNYEESRLFVMPGDEVNPLKLNKQRNTVASKLAAQLNNGVLPSTYRKGVVPKYIRERKEAAKKEEKTKAEALQSDCPEGYMALPDEDRKETLLLLKSKYQECVNELNKLPIRTDTLRAQKQKMEIEKKLNKIEEGIKVFSRPKVYVKMDA